MLQHYSISPKTLRNIFLCKWYRLVGKLKYPSSILPKVSYEAKMNMDSLTNSQLYLLRRSNNPFDKTFNKMGDYFVLREDAIGYKDVPGLSLNLLGGKFKIRHLKYKVLMKTPASQKWDGTTQIFLSEHLNDFEVVKGGCPIFLDANKLHDKPIPYDREKNSHLDKEVQNFFNNMIPAGIDVGNKYKLEARIKLAHDPINLNYWHVEYELYDFQNTRLDATKGKTWIEDLAKQVFKNIISINSYPVLPAIESISKTAFKKSA